MRSECKVLRVGYGETVWGEPPQHGEELAQIGCFCCAASDSQLAKVDYLEAGAIRLEEDVSCVKITMRDDALRWP